MARYSQGPGGSERSRNASSESFLEAAKGRAIFLGTDYGPERVVFQLTGRAQLRILWVPSGLQLDLTSTVVFDEIPPVIVPLGAEDESLDLKTLTRRLQAFGTIHAIVQLLMTDRERLLAAALESDATSDVENLLSEDETVYLEALTPGSILATIRASATTSYRTIVLLIRTVLPRTREALIRKLEADAHLIEAQAQLAAAQARKIDAEAHYVDAQTNKVEVEVAAERARVEKELLDIAREQVEYQLSLADKLPPGRSREHLYALVERELTAMLGKHASPGEVQLATGRLLGPRSQ
jgi:hypothetical protein